MVTITASHLGAAVVSDYKWSHQEITSHLCTSNTWYKLHEVKQVVPNSPVFFEVHDTGGDGMFIRLGYSGDGTTYYPCVNTAISFPESFVLTRRTSGLFTNITSTTQTVTAPYVALFAKLSAVATTENNSCTTTAYWQTS